MIPTLEIGAAACAGALSRLLAIGFDEAGVRARLGLRDLNDISGKALPIYRREHLGARDPLASAIDLFVMQGSLPTSEVDTLFGAPDQQALVRAGVLERHEDAVHARLSLYPVGRRLVFSDHAWPQVGRAARSLVFPDRVMYVGTDSRWLARATVRKPIAAALDLCTGSGIHALLAARHAAHATAVDINPRAVRCTTFNAEAMGLTNVRALQGDLYAPVSRGRFDLITANPPFVPAPAQKLGFRDGGPTGEDVQRRIVEGLPRHLGKGGIAQIVTELGERPGETLEPRLRQWLGDAPMDIHVLRLRVHSAQSYAVGHASGEDTQAVLDSVDRWAANLAAQRYERVVSVLLAFQWSDEPWYREDEAHPPTMDAGWEIEAIFSAERLARDPSLKERLRAATVARTAPLALIETRGVGFETTTAVQARLLGPAIGIEHALEPIEREILVCMEHPIAVAELVSAATKASVSEESVLAAMVSLVRKGLIRTEAR